MKKLYYLFFLFLLFISNYVLAQNSTDTISRELTLQQCIDFALRNQPAVRQAAIDEQINERDIRIGLAGWLPQLTTNGSYNHYFQSAARTLATSGSSTGTTTGTGGTSGTGTSTTTPTTSVGGVARNVSSVTFQASQTIYNNDVFLASRAAKYSRQYYREGTEVSQISVVADVSKSFFDVLLSEKQLDILNEDIIRLKRSLKDANSRYQAGVADKIDYKQATISLNNSIASRKQTQEAINSKTAYLKQVMGLPAEKQLDLKYDSAKFVQDAVIDTNQTLSVEKRVEYRQLAAQKNLQLLNVSYYRFGWLPSLSAVGSYNMLYFNDHFADQYNNNYPTSLVGLSLTMPIFTGTKRLQNLSKARLQVDRADLDIINTKNVINTEYVQALSSYKSNYTNWVLLKQNVDLAKDVYKVVELQYREGIKTYLDVTVSQTDLRTAELNYYNALFTLLSSKVDLQKALGILIVR
ncbi:TolC family protein [Mucilaginibacter polytrichastri]|uniref:Outer membrane protein TolC n=1 Tax=Mucilaginibacter polytrichastri TaxID=1302689 RepID=A0A1Q5ZYF8_9SPHI|nr:TolC family protein [Mucilaginibacter polytrichastri]OKS86779.1 hypothetical protein RG47T_2236 [Mucilaginibacter polytrichastri]SFT22602.1 Outer membrane protein TolC [Mucilaginibacter polytrichastri]